MHYIPLEYLKMSCELIEAFDRKIGDVPSTLYTINPCKIKKDTAL